MSEFGELDLWVKEVHLGYVGQSFRVEKTLFSGQSRFQKIDIVQTTGHGAMLLNDGIIMLSERDEHIYHEMIVHVPLFVHPNPKTVLIIGGGDGGTVREALRHRSIEKVVMVEIDGMVVDACKQHIPSVSCALDSPKLELLIDDGVKYVAQSQDTFDIVIIDSTDPIGPAKPLFNTSFYQNVANILSPDGIMITQAESVYYDTDIQVAMFKNQRPFFNRLHIYVFSNLTYPGGVWSFGFASNSLHPVKDFDPENVRRSGIETKYYNPDIHFSSFLLPNFIKNNLKGLIDEVSYKDMAMQAK